MKDVLPNQIGAEIIPTEPTRPVNQKVTVFEQIQTVTQIKNQRLRGFKR